jgi:CRP-like cAMP-binding protein
MTAPLSPMSPTRSAGKKGGVGAGVSALAAIVDGGLNEVWREIGPVWLAWDVLGALLVLYELVMVPLMVFGLPENNASHAMALVMPIFWLLDFYRELDAGAWQYALSWMAFDVLMLTLDLMVAMTSPGQLVGDASSGAVLEGLSFVAGSEGINWPTAFRVARLTRVVRVRLRLTPVAASLAACAPWRLECSELMASVAEAVALTALCVHFVACGFYGAGSMDKDQPDAWLHQYLAGRHEGQPGYVGHAYVTALQWALSQFTFATVDVQPIRTMERTYACCSAFVATALFAWLLGRIALAATPLAASRRRRGDVMNSACEYLDEHGANALLRRRVLTWAWLEVEGAKAAPSSGRRGGACQELARALAPSSLSCIDKAADLPNALRTQLDTLVFVPAVMSHPLFAWLQSSQEDAARGLYRCLEESFLAPGETLFAKGDTASRAYIVVRGELRYSLPPSSSSTASAAEPPVQLDAGRWFGEPALWVDGWTRKGCASAALAGWAPSELMALPSALLQELLLQEPHRFALHVVAAYARSYVRHAQALKRLTDASEDADAWQQIFQAAEGEVEEVVKSHDSPTKGGARSHIDKRKAVHDRKRNSKSAYRENQKELEFIRSAGREPKQATIEKKRFIELAPAKDFFHCKGSKQSAVEPLPMAPHVISVRPKQSLAKTLSIGSRVRIGGLAPDSKLNGMDGVLQRYNDTLDRWTVRMDGGKEVALKEKYYTIIEPLAPAIDAGRGETDRILQRGESSTATSSNLRAAAQSETEELLQLGISCRSDEHGQVSKEEAQENSRDIAASSDSVAELVDGQDSKSSKSIASFANKARERLEASNASRAASLECASPTAQIDGPDAPGAVVHEGAVDHFHAADVAGAAPSEPP